MIKAGITTMIGSIVFQTGALAQLHVKNPGNVGIGLMLLFPAVVLTTRCI